MKRQLLFTALLLACSASVASAQGINLSWTDCGAAGQQNRTFACNTNSGFAALIASYIPPAGVDRFVGLSSQIDIVTDQSVLPDWWKHGSASLCRGTGGLVVDFNFTTGPFSCSDVYGGQAAGGYAYDVGFGSPARARLRIQCAIPADLAAPIDPSLEWYGYKVNLLFSKTTGTGACSGCTNSACIVLNEIQLFQPVEAQFDPEIVNPADRNFVTWQLPFGGPPGCPLATPNRAATWGQLKSLYR